MDLGRDIQLNARLWDLERLIFYLIWFHRLYEHINCLWKLHPIRHAQRRRKVPLGFLSSFRTSVILHWRHFDTDCILQQRRLQNQQIHRHNNPAHRNIWSNLHNFCSSSRSDFIVCRLLDIRRCHLSHLSICPPLRLLGEYAPYCNPVYKQISTS